MRELWQAGENTWYVYSRNIFGFYQLNDTDVCMIDTGRDPEDIEFAEKVLADKGWNLKFIINTHTHIDHIGGNKALMAKWGCPAYTTGIERLFAEYEELEPAFMFGGRPSAEVREVFKHPGDIGFRDIEDFELPEGFEILHMPGHTFGMIGVKTPDDVWFVADSIMNRKALKKYPFGFLINVESYLETLEKLKGLEGKFFIPAHGESMGKEIASLAEENTANIRRHIDFIAGCCRGGKSVDLVVRDVFKEYGMKETEIQYTLVASTVRCYLTYLKDAGRMECYSDDGLIKWKTIDGGTI